MHPSSLLTLAWLSAWSLADPRPPAPRWFEVREDLVVTDPSILTLRFGEQQFAPEGGFLLSVGQRLPDLVWDHPELVATVVPDPAIPTRWFNERFEEVRIADKPGRYYAYGAAPVPSGPPLRRALTCVCVGSRVDLADLAERRIQATRPGAAVQSQHVEAMILRWENSEAGEVELAAILELQQPDLHRASRSVANGKRDTAGSLETETHGAGQPAHRQSDRSAGRRRTLCRLRRGSLDDARMTQEQVRTIELKLDEWYAHSLQPMAVVIARNGVVFVRQGYGAVEGEPVTIDTPMLLHSAMKPLIGLQLAMYVNRGFIKLDEPLGNYLPDFNSPQDRGLTFRAGQVHATGIHFPWELAFRRLFYFHTWHESLIAHCRREWAPGAQHRYGVVGVILSVRALELLRGRNYWDAMERDLLRTAGNPQRVAGRNRLLSREHGSDRRRSGQPREVRAPRGDLGERPMPRSFLHHSNPGSPTWTCLTALDYRTTPACWAKAALGTVADADAAHRPSRRTSRLCDGAE